MQSDLPMFAVYKPIRSRGWVEEWSRYPKFTHNTVETR
jgi:hypothetical protein